MKSRYANKMMGKVRQALDREPAPKPSAACSRCGTSGGNMTMSSMDHRGNYLGKSQTLCMNTAACDARVRDSA